MVGGASGVHIARLEGLTRDVSVVLVSVVACGASVLVRVLALSCGYPSATQIRKVHMLMAHLPLTSVFNSVPLVRIPAGSSVCVTIQSVAVEVVRTHWFGRQYACPCTDCPACENYQSRLTCFCVVTVWTGKVWIPGLLELTPSALSRLQFMLSWEAGEMVPGVVVVVSRKSSRSGVLVEPQDRQSGPLLSALASRAVLFNSICRLLGLPSGREGEADSAWAERVKPFLIARLEKAIAEKG